MKNELAILFAAACAAMTGCEGGREQPTPPAPAAAHDHAHDAGDGHEHVDQGDGDAHAAMARAEMGVATVGAFEVKAARYGDVTPGRELDVDLSVAGPAKPAAVRAWVGLEDGSGSLKSKAEPEGESYHVHVEVPDPIPTGSSLWVEVESAEGERTTGSFPLGS